jgi:environmental stress-induced protein Ves
MRQSFHLSSRAVMPWKNGSGSTRELAIWPQSAGVGDFDWRISIADIERDGPFSIFPGIDRNIMLLDGAGVELIGPDISHRLSVRCRCYAFAGELEVSARLLVGTSRDFNAMHRRDKYHATVEVLVKTSRLEAVEHGLLFCLQGTFSANGERLERDCGIWWADEPTAWHLETRDAASQLIAVTFARRSSPVKDVGQNSV